jgi:hypothetical protein
MTKLKRKVAINQTEEQKGSTFPNKGDRICKIPVVEGLMALSRN